MSIGFSGLSGHALVSPLYSVVFLKRYGEQVADIAYERDLQIGVQLAELGANTTQRPIHWFEFVPEFLGSQQVPVVESLATCLHG